MADHLKRLAAPNTWPIKTKGITYITRPAGAGSSMSHSVPLVIAFKEMLGLATSTKEVKKILHHQEVFVDGNRVHDHDASVGFMGTLSIPKLKLYYRLSITQKNKLTLIPITDKESTKRPCRVEGKTDLAKGKIQLNCSDGFNVIMKKDDYKTADTVLVEGKKVVEHYSFKKGCPIFLMKGAHVGHLATVEAVQGKTVTLKADDGKVFETARKYCLVVGKEKPSISVKA